jgi:hypothetical protein
MCGPPWCDAGPQYTPRGILVHIANFPCTYIILDCHPSLCNVAVAQHTCATDRLFADKMTRRRLLLVPLSGIVFRVAYFPGRV